MIQFDRVKKIFNLDTLTTSYKIQCDEDDRLLHLYYGSKSADDVKIEVSHHDKGCMPNLLPQEWPSFGLGDNHEPFFDLVWQNGSRAVSLKYKNHEIYKGKRNIPGLPALFNADESIDIFLEDERGLELVLTYSVFEEADVITRSASIKNKSENSIIIQGMPSAVIDFTEQNLDFISFYGTWANERNLYRSEVRPGVQSVSSVTGLSSHSHNPSVILCEPSTNEYEGKVWGFSLVYSGNFKIQVERAESGIRLSGGISPTTFTWTLNKGEIFYAPEIVLAFSSNGFSSLREHMHLAVRKHLIRGQWRNEEKKKPVLINSWEACYFNFDEDKLLNLATAAKKAGADLFVLDDGWFGERNSDNGSLGDWTVDKNKLPNGIEGLCQKINEIGLDFGIWLEPEAVSPNSHFYVNNPGVAFEIDGLDTLEIRNQYVLDFSRDDVRDKIIAQVKALLDSCDIRYVKWDMNRALANVYNSQLGADYQGEVYHRYVLGVYEFQDWLIRSYPEILLENCAGGGGRFDLGMLFYSPQIWCSDNTDAYDRLKIQYGTSFFYPTSAIGSHYSTVPNHITGRVSSVEARMAIAMTGTFGYELDLTEYNDEDLNILRKFSDFYRARQELIRTGDLKWIFTPNNDGAVWAIVSKDRREAIMFASGAVLKGQIIKLPFELLDIDYSAYVLRATIDNTVNDEVLVCKGNDINNLGFALPSLSGTFPGYICYLGAK